jgi:RNA recognition motif-containing protein
MNYETESFFDQEISFSYEGQDYLWIGDYSVESFGEEESEYAPAYGEIEVIIDHTHSLSSYENGYEIVPTRSMLMALELEIERNY